MNVHRSTSWYGRSRYSYMIHTYIYSNVYRIYPRGVIMHDVAGTCLGSLSCHVEDSDAASLKS